MPSILNEKRWKTCFWTYHNWKWDMFCG